MSKTVCPIPRVANEGNITITAVKDGIHGNDRITINGGKIYTKSTEGDEIDSNGDITMNGGMVVAIGSNQPEAGIEL